MRYSRIPGHPCQPMRYSHYAIPMRYSLQTNLCATAVSISHCAMASYSHAHCWDNALRPATAMPLLGFMRYGQLQPCLLSG